jgi:hypothetical protein
MFLTTSEVSEILRILSFLNDSDTKLYDISLGLDLFDIDGEPCGAIAYNSDTKEYTFEPPSGDNE